MKALFRCGIGFCLLELYRVCLYGGKLLADEIGSGIGESYNYYIFPFCWTAAILLFGYLARWLCRWVEVPYAPDLPVRRRLPARPTTTTRSEGRRPGR